MKCLRPYLQNFWVQSVGETTLLLSQWKHTPRQAIPAGGAEGAVGQGSAKLSEELVGLQGAGADRGLVQTLSWKVAWICGTGSTARGSTPCFFILTLSAHPRSVTGSIPTRGASLFVTQLQLLSLTESPSTAECHPLTQILPPSMPAPDLEGFWGRWQEEPITPSPSAEETGMQSPICGVPWGGGGGTSNCRAAKGH